MTRNIKKLILIAGVVALVGLDFKPSQAQSNSEANLYRVRKIFLETQNNRDLSDQGMAEFRRLHPILKEELSNFGFVVVDNSTEADAVMYGANTIGWVALHGPPIDPPKYGFQFWLSSSKYHFQWQTDFNISSHSEGVELDRKAVQKAARNLFRAWKKSATHTGIVVHDRLP